MVARGVNGDSECVERQKPPHIGRNTTMHELLVALSLAALTFMPCIVTMDNDACELEEAA